MIKHELKINPEFFKEIKDESKNFEIRKNDRNFCVNDILVLKEYDPDTKQYTGRTIDRIVDYILFGGQYGLEEGYVCMSIRKVNGWDYYFLNDEEE